MLKQKSCNPSPLDYQQVLLYVIQKITNKYSLLLFNSSSQDNGKENSFLVNYAR